MSQEIDLSPFRTPRAARFHRTTAVRYGDLDPNGHVNHMRYLAYIEECRLAHRRALLETLDPGQALGWPVGGLTIRYLASLTYPGQARVESAPIRLGRTSFTLGYGIFDDERCMAIAHSQSVCIDRASGRAIPMPAPVRQALGPEIEPAFAASGGESN